MSSISKSAEVIVSEIELKSSTHNGFFLLVEGDFDQRFFDERVDEDLKIVNCTGKQVNIDSMSILNQKGIVNYFSLIDKDRDFILNKNHASINCTYTDDSDLEITLLNTITGGISSCVKRIINQSCDAGKVSNFKLFFGVDLEEKIREIAASYGFLRLMNEKYDLRFDFKKISILNNKYLQIDTNGFVFNEILLETDFLNGVDINKLSQALFFTEKQKYSQNLCDWSLVQGHDYIKILASSINSKLFKKSKHVNVCENSMARDLCLMISNNDISNKSFFKFFRAYENSFGLRFFK